MAINIPSLFRDVIETPEQRQQRKMLERLGQAQSFMAPRGSVAALANPLASATFMNIAESQDRVKENLGGMLGLDMRDSSQKLSDALMAGDPNTPEGLKDLSKQLQNIFPAQSLGLLQAATEQEQIAEDRRVAEQERLRNNEIRELQRQDYAQRIAKGKAEAERTPEIQSREDSLFKEKQEINRLQNLIAQEELKQLEIGDITNQGTYRVNGQEFIGAFRNGIPSIYNPETQKYEPSNIVFGQQNLVKLGEDRTFDDFAEPIQNDLNEMSENRNTIASEIQETEQLLTDIKSGALPEARTGRGFVAALSQRFGDDKAQIIMQKLTADRVKRSFELLPPGTASELEGSRALDAEFDLAKANISTIIEALTINLSANIYEKYKNKEVLNYLYSSQKTPNLKDYNDFLSNLRDGSKGNDELQQLYRQSGISIEENTGGVTVNTPEIDALVDQLNRGSVDINDSSVFAN